MNDQVDENVRTISNGIVVNIFLFERKFIKNILIFEFLLLIS